MKSILFAAAGALVTCVLAAGCADRPSFEVTKAPTAPVNVKRMAVYFNPEWHARPTGDTWEAMEMVPAVHHFADVMAQSVPVTLGPMLQEHGVSIATKPEPGLMVLYMRVGNALRLCYDHHECTTKVQVHGDVGTGEAEPIWSFDADFLPSYLDMKKFTDFEHELVKKMADDGVIPK